MKRPASLAEVASHAESREDFAYALAEFLDQFYLEKLAEMLSEEPRLLSDTLHDGCLADAYLAAVCVHLSRAIAQVPPGWTRSAGRFLSKPWFANRGASLRATLLLESPAAFRERNLFVSENALERA